MKSADIKDLLRTSINNKRDEAERVMDIVTEPYEELLRSFIEKYGGATLRFTLPYNLNDHSFDKDSCVFLPRLLEHMRTKNEGKEIIMEAVMGIIQQSAYIIGFDTTRLSPTQIEIKFLRIN